MHEEVELGSSPASKVAPPKIARRRWQKLHLETRAWWNEWLGSPQASELIGTDWRRLFMVVLPLVEDFNRAVEQGDFDRAQRRGDAIAKHELELGGTAYARRRMRWNVRPPAHTSPEVSEEGSEGTTAKRRMRKVRNDPRLSLVKTDKKEARGG